MHLPEPAQTESLRRLGTLQMIPVKYLPGTFLILRHQHHFRTRNTCDGGTVLHRLADAVRYDFLRYHRSDRVVDQYDVIRLMFPSNLHEPSVNRVLSAVSAFYDRAYLRQVKLLHISPQHLLPSLNTDHHDLIYRWMPLEHLQRIDNDRLFIYREKLFRYVLMHTVPASPGYHHCYVHMNLHALPATLFRHPYRRAV